MITRVATCPSCGHSFAPGLDTPASPPPPPPPLAPPPQASSFVPPVPPYPAPPAPSREGGGLSAASVPKILLGLGATCLLVAAVIFLAVAWSWLGVGGRTAVLVGLTAASALTGQWLARRDLGVAAEALTTVALGLAVLDIVGASDAGWLGTPTPEAFVVQLGAALFAVSIGLCLPARRLFVPQLAAPVGLGAAFGGVALTTAHPQLLAMTAVLCFTGLALVGRRVGAVVLPWTSGTGAALALASLAGQATTEASEHPTLRGLWLEGHGLGMLALAALVLLPWPIARGHDDLRQLVCAVSVSLLTWTAVVPVFDEGLTAITCAAAGCTLLWASVAAASPLRWYAVPRVPLVGSMLGLLPVSATLVAHGVVNLFTVAEPFTADVSVRLDPRPSELHPLLLPLCVAVAVVAALLTLPRSVVSGYTVAGVAALTALLTAAQYPLPLVAFVVVLGPFGVVLALPSAVLTLAVLVEIVLVAAYVMARRTGPVADLAGAVLPTALALTLWTVGHVFDVSFMGRSLLTVALVGLLAVAVARLEVELMACVAVLGSGMAAVPAAADPSVALAVHLTLAGTLVVTTALVHPSHRQLAWLGGLLLAGATWVRLYDVGVVAPEPYTVPTAAVLVLVGLHRLHRDPEADTVTALLPGLALAVVPTLLWALVDPLSWRAVAVGLAALVLLLGGTALRWTAPVLVGGLAGAAVVLRELAPYAAAWPQWVLIGAAGTVLFGAGITWEARLRDLRKAAAYLGRLR